LAITTRRVWTDR